MFCENCGNKLDSSDKFCTKCGIPVQGNVKPYVSTTSVSDEKWWYRLLKVVYIFLYFPLPLLLWLVWELNASSYSYYGGYTDNSGQAFWYCLITLVIYLAIVRLIKICALYIAIGKRPDWKREFKKLF